MSSARNNLIWIDLEMTGLDPDFDRIIEIAVIITNPHLEILAEGPVFAISQPAEILTKMDAWNQEHHSKSGLIERVRASKITEADAEKAILQFITSYVAAKKSPMCGNSICQDRRFLYRYMPQLEQYFHYRNLDVSTIKILAQMWNPKIYSALTKETTHTALQDIRDSIDELRFYRRHLFIPN